MGLIDWKQISPQLKDDGYLTGSLSITGSLFVNGNDASGTRVSGSGLDGVQLTGVQGETVFDSSTGLHVTQSADKIAQVFIGPKIATTGSNTFTGNQDIYGNLTVDGDVVAQRFIVSSSVSIITQSFSSGSTIFGDDLTDIHEYTGSLFISNSLVVSGTAHFIAENTQSTAITSNNTTVGYPTIFPWVTGLEGSYFQRFDHSTHISEIGRFIAGVLSSSLDVADTSPNTKYWNNVSTTHTLGNTTSKSSLFNGVLGSSYENAKLSINWTGSSYISNTATASYREVQDYLLAKGWLQASDRGTYGNDTGTNPFHGSYASRIPNTIQRQNNFSTNRFTVTANAGGSTNASSNDNYFGLGPLNLGQPVPYTVRILASQSFSDNYFDTNPEADATFTTSASVDYTRSTFGTSNGLVLSEILSSQPAVIPSSFQDGDFNNVSGPINGRKYTGNQTDAANISASGYYKTYDIKVGLKSGSQEDFTFKNAADSSTRFYLYTGDIPSDITSGTPTAVISNVNLNRTSFGATSRSLSGAPYLQSLSYTFDYSAEVANCFDPAYGYASTVLTNSNPTNEWNNVGTTSLSNTTVTVNSSGVQTDDSNVRGVLSADKSTQRAVGDLPHIDDIVYCSSSFSFNIISSNVNTTTQNRSTQESTNYNLSVRTQCINWKNSSQTQTTSSISLFDSSLIGKSADIGSLIVYTRAQGYDGGSLTGTTEQFTGEDFRIKLNNNVVTFSGDAFVSDTYATNDDGDAVLGDYDLQVKPGYLVDPGGNYGYWFPSGFGTGTYKYYIRQFQITGTKLNMTVDVGKTLVNWNSTNTGVAAAILYKSTGRGSGHNVTLSQARIFDPSMLVDSIVEQNVSPDNFKNPFNETIDLYGNVSGVKTGTSYFMSMRNSEGMYLDANDNRLYVIVRYKNDPTPVRSITVTTS